MVVLETSHIAIYTSGYLDTAGLMATALTSSWDYLKCEADMAGQREQGTYSPVDVRITPMLACTLKLGKHRIQICRQLKSVKAVVHVC